MLVGVGTQDVGQRDGIGVIRLLADIEVRSR
jgi:hypothetical protein